VGGSSFRSRLNPPVIVLSRRAALVDVALSLAHQSLRARRLLEDLEYPHILNDGREEFIWKGIQMGLDCYFHEMSVARELLHFAGPEFEDELFKNPALRTYFRTSFGTRYGQRPTELELRQDKASGTAATVLIEAGWRAEHSRFIAPQDMRAYGEQWDRVRRGQKTPAASETQLEALPTGAVWFYNTAKPASA
jgi:hypothetical protein